MAKTATKKAATKPIEVMRSVKVYYKDQETTNMGRQMSYALKEKEVIKAEAKAQADAFKNQIAAQETIVKTLSDAINLGYQMVQKPCTLVKNFENGVREYWFDGEIVETEALTSGDYQAELDFAEKANQEEASRVENLTKKDDAKDSSDKTDQGNTAETASEDQKEKIESPELTKEQLEQYTEFVHKGDEAHKAKKYHEALKFYEAANKLNPADQKTADKLLKSQNWISHVNEAEEKEKRRRKKKKKDATDHNENNPLDDQAEDKEKAAKKLFADRFKNGVAFMAERKYSEAEEQFRLSLEIDPENEQALAKHKEAVQYLKLMKDAGIPAGEKE